MKKQVIILSTLLIAGFLVAGCTSVQPQSQSTTTGDVGLANPSAVCCEEKGGYYTINTDADGNQNGYCDLGGTKTEAWEFFDKNCKEESEVKGENIESETASIKELLDNPVYNQEVTIQGKISNLGDLMCPCFELTENRATVQVWYDLMVDEEGKQKEKVDMGRFRNGDEVIITGELREQPGQSSYKDFWMSKIERTK